MINYDSYHRLDSFDDKQKLDLLFKNSIFIKCISTFEINVLVGRWYETSSPPDYNLDLKSYKKFGVQIFNKEAILFEKDIKELGLDKLNLKYTGIQKILKANYYPVTLKELESIENLITNYIKT